MHLEGTMVKKDKAQSGPTSFITGFRMLSELAHGRAKSREDFVKPRYGGAVEALGEADSVTNSPRSPKRTDHWGGHRRDGVHGEDLGNDDGECFDEMNTLKETPADLLETNSRPAKRKLHYTKRQLDIDKENDILDETPMEIAVKVASAAVLEDIMDHEATIEDGSPQQTPRIIPHCNKVIGPRSLNGFTFHSLVPRDGVLGGEVYGVGMFKCRCKGVGCHICKNGGELAPIPNDSEFMEITSLKDQRICEIASGDDHHAALTADGKVFTWGRGDKGQLGHGDNENQVSPKLVEGLENCIVRQVCCGQWHCLVLTETGDVYTWGADADLCNKVSPGCVKQPGNVPRKIDIDKRVVHITAGYTHSICVSETGHMYTWGHGPQSQRRYVWEKLAQPKPLLYSKLPNKRVAEVATGTYMTVLTTMGQGEVYSWGKGYIGVGEYCEKKNPSLVKNLAGKRIARVSCGPYFCHCVSDEGQVYSFGHGDHGVLGHGDTKHQGIPKLVQAFRNTSILSVKCGSRHAAAVTVWGEVFVWGSNAYSRLGLENQGSSESVGDAQLVPIIVDVAGRVSEVSCGTHHTLTCSGVRAPSYYLGRGNGELMIEEILGGMGWVRVPKEMRWTSKYTMKWLQNSSELDFRMLKEGFQVMNHIPNHRVFTSKNGLLQTLREYAEKHTDCSLYSFIPETFRLDNPGEKKEFFEMALNNEEDVNDTLWILKPTSLNCGQGIEVIRDVTRLAEEFDYILPSRARDERRRISYSPGRSKNSDSPPTSPHRGREPSPGRTEDKAGQGNGSPAAGTDSTGHRQSRLSPPRWRGSHNALAEPKGSTMSPSNGGRPLPWQNTRKERKSYPHIIQRYISNVLTIDNKKFDIRVYMFIASTDPFLVFYHDGYLRLSLEPLDLANETNTFSHLTNAAIQKKHPDYETRIGENIWSFDQFQEYLTRNKVAPPDWVRGAMTNRMKEIMVTLINASKFKLSRKIGCFDLYGIDFMVDTNLNLWLIEVNTNPAITRDCDYLAQFLPPVLTETIQLSLEVFHLQQQQKVHSKDGVEINAQSLTTLTTFETIVDEGLRTPYYFSPKHG